MGLGVIVSLGDCNNPVLSDERGHQEANNDTVDEEGPEDHRVCF